MFPDIYAMKRAFFSIFILLCLAVVTSSAQTPSNSIIVDAASFRPVQTDALTGIAIDPIPLDGSKRPCTRLKMRINRMTREEIGELAFRLRGGVIDLRKCQVAHEGNGLIIEMTAYKNTVFYLQHPRFGMSNEVTISTEGNKEYYIEASLNQLYPITVQSNVPDVEVYIDGALVGRTNAECVLSVADVLPGQHRLKMVYGSSVKEQTVEVHRNSTFFHQEVDAEATKSQYVLFSVQPATAVVTLNGEILPLDEGGSTYKTLPPGAYAYRVEAQEYHAEEGRIVVSGEKVVKSIALRPAFGWLKVVGSSVDGATIYVDNQRKGVAPISEAIRLASGDHTVHIVKRKYKNYTTQVTITDNQTSTLTPSLAANFAVVSLSVADGAEIWVDNEHKGNGSWRGELEIGSHRVECRKAGHRTSEEGVEVATSAPIARVLTAPSPINGSLDVVSSPLMAEVWVDGRNVGNTPLTMSSILVGKHTVELCKDGYATWSREVTITEGQTATLEATLSKQAPIDNSFCEMVFVKGGTFTMGATEEQGSDAWTIEKPAHSVTVSDFYIGKYEVTQAQWKAIMGNNPSKRIGDDLPVERVSWGDIQEFIRKLYQKTGRKYRLPTEAEWEYAARGGANSGGYKYSGSNDIGAVAWYKDNSDGKTYPVGQKQPNELGLYDMCGNVMEWCQDWFSSSYYFNGPQTNPIGPNRGSRRILRGGGWNYSARFCRVSFRANSTLWDRDDYFGFRLVCEPSTTKEAYKVGDYYNIGGKEGVVFEVTSDGRHGKIVCLDDLGKMTWDEANKACEQMGNGWYLPAKEELLEIRRLYRTLNSTIENRGRELFVYGGAYWSSTPREEEPRFKHCAVYSNDTHYSDDYSTNIVRAVSAF